MLSAHGLCKTKSHSFSQYKLSLNHISSILTCSSRSNISLNNDFSVLLSRKFKTDAKVSQAMAAPSFSSINKEPFLAPNTKISSSSLLGSLSNNDDANNTSWSSSKDVISRHHFLKDFSHLWTLLEACLDSGNMTRAENVLISFSKHSKEAEIVSAVNKYLYRLVELNEQDETVAKNWLKSISSKIPMFTPNSATKAILLRNKCLATNFSKNNIELFLQVNSKKCLNHIEILGADMLAKILQVCFSLPFFSFAINFTN